MERKAYALDAPAYDQFVKRTEAIDRAAERRPHVARVFVWGAKPYLPETGLYVDIGLPKGIITFRELSSASAAICSDFVQLNKNFAFVDDSENDMAPRVKPAIQRSRSRDEEPLIATDSAVVPAFNAPLSWLLSRMVTAFFFALSTIAAYFGIGELVTGEPLQALPTGFAALLLFLLGVISILVRKRAEGIWRRHTTSTSRSE